MASFRLLLGATGAADVGLGFLYSSAPGPLAPRVLLWHQDCPGLHPNMSKTTSRWGHSLGGCAEALSQRTGFYLEIYQHLYTVPKPGDMGVPGKCPFTERAYLGGKAALALTYAQLFSLGNENWERNKTHFSPLIRKENFFRPWERELRCRKRAERIKILAELNAINLINLPCDTLHKKVRGQSLACELTFHLQPLRSQWGPGRLSQLPAALHNEIGHSFQHEGEYL